MTARELADAIKAEAGREGSRIVIQLGDVKQETRCAMVKAKLKRAIAPYCLAVLGVQKRVLEVLVAAMREEE